MAVVEVVEVDLQPPGAPRLGWGWFLALGIGWILVGLSILSLHPATIAAISWLVGLVVLVAGLVEVVNVFTSPGWRWLHAGLGLVLVVAGAAALTNPFETFVGLSIVLGWFLVLKGISTLVVAVVNRTPGSLWGLALGIGLAQLALGIWALGYPGRSAWLLVLWLGAGALVTGTVDIIRALDQRQGAA